MRRDVVANCRRWSGGHCRVTRHRCLDRGLDLRGRCRLSEEVQHQRRRDDRGTRIGLAGADDIGRRTVHRLEHRGTCTSRVEVRRRGKADTATHCSCEVGKDVTEKVVGHQHVVALRRIHEVDTRCIDMVIRRLDVAILASHLVERALPKVARELQHVRLMDQCKVPARAAAGKFKRETHAALYSHACVDTALRRYFVGRPPAKESALASVGAFGVLTNHDAVDVVLGIEERTLVDVQVQLEAHLQQQTALKHSRGDAGCADGTKQDCVVPSQFRQSRVGKRFAGCMVPASTEVVLFRVESHARCGNDLQCFGGDFGTDSIATEDGNLVLFRHGRTRYKSRYRDPQQLAVATRRGLSD